MTLGGGPHSHHLLRATRSCRGYFLDFLKERGVDYAAGEARDKAADEATLQWLGRQAPDKREPA